jgi:glutathione-regulated potassium-efflux system ancillary protein KefC
VAAFLLVKTAVLYLLAMMTGIPRSQRALFAFLLSQGGEFAFVVFGAAQAARVFTDNVGSILIVVVALSMVCTPLLLIFHDKVIEPRNRVDKRREADAIDANDGHVIIAGFGRFGQIVGRLLKVNGVKLTVLDHDPDQIDLLRKFGNKVFYGDVTRIDLLHAAGAATARALVVAIDDIDDSLKLVDAVRRAYPALPIMARARNVTHYFDLMDRGVTVIERETFESALLLGRNVLTHLGFGAYRARQAAMKFRAMNLQGLSKMYPFYKDQEQFVSMAKQARDELEDMFALDAAAVEAERRTGWD